MSEVASCNAVTWPKPERKKEKKIGTFITPVTEGRPHLAGSIAETGPADAAQYRLGYPVEWMEPFVARFGQSAA